MWLYCAASFPCHMSITVKGVDIGILCIVAYCICCLVRSGRCRKPLLALQSVLTIFKQSKLMSDRQIINVNGSSKSGAKHSKNLCAWHLPIRLASFSSYHVYSISKKLHMTWLVHSSWTLDVNPYTTHRADVLNLSHNTPQRWPSLWTQLLVRDSSFLRFICMDCPVHKRWLDPTRADSGAKAQRKASASAHR